MIPVLFNNPLKKLSNAPLIGPSSEPEMSLKIVRPIDSAPPFNSEIKLWKTPLPLTKMSSKNWPPAFDISLKLALV